MTTRCLPPEEWPRLAGTELEAVWPHLRPAHQATVLVVEDGEAIVGCWLLLTLAHCEGVWVAPTHRGKGSVARRLLAAMRREVQQRGFATVLTGAMTPDVERIIRGLGGHPLPGAQYVLPFGA